RQRTALLRLARPRAAAGRHGRKGQARADQQARQRLSAPSAGHRRDVGAVQQASQGGPWLVKLLQTKKRKVAACAFANKMARLGWAVMMRQEDFRRRRPDQPCPDRPPPGTVLTAVKTAARA